MQKVHRRVSAPTMYLLFQQIFGEMLMYPRRHTQDELGSSYQIKSFQSLQDCRACKDLSLDQVWMALPHRSRGQPSKPKQSVLEISVHSSVVLRPLQRKIYKNKHNGTFINTCAILAEASQKHPAWCRYANWKVLVHCTWSLIKFGRKGQTTLPVAPAPLVTMQIIGIKKLL